jgi:hypothetical protein
MIKKFVHRIHGFTRILAAKTREETRKRLKLRLRKRPFRKNSLILGRWGDGKGGLSNFWYEILLEKAGSPDFSNEIFPYMP